MNPLAMAYAEAERGMKRAKAHAEAIDPEWSRTASLMLDAYCVQRPGRQFTSENFREWCEARGFPIPVPKALGPLFKQAARVGTIVKDGYSVAADRHGSPTVLWRSSR